MQIECLFIGGLDTDTTDLLIEQGDYRFALNCHIGSSDKDNVGAVENLKGNKEISYILPEGKNKVIGKFEDVEGQSVVYMVWNELSNHSILQYIYNENKVVKVVEDPVLNFNKDFLITGTNLINGLFFWTDEFDNPKKINIQKAKNYSSPSNPVVNNFTLNDLGKILIGKVILADTDTNLNIGDIVKGKIDTLNHIDGTIYFNVNEKYYGLTRFQYFENAETYVSPLKKTYFTQLKPPPMLNPKVDYLASNNNVNYLKGKLFQFKALFVYDDLEQTKTSAISTTPLPDENDYFDNNNPSLNSAIQVTVETGSSIVKRIRILAREGNTGNFFFIADLDKEKLGIPDDSFYHYYFYNDKSYSFIDTTLSNLLFDAVPDLSKAQELIEGERIAHANITEGFDPIDIDLNVSVKIKNVDVSGLSGDGHSVKGRVFIRNNNYSDNFGLFQPICIDADDDSQGSITFGGVVSKLPTVGSPPPFNFENGIVNDFKQSCELGGFPIYLKGTNLFSISKQVQITGIDNLSQNSNGVLNAAKETSFPENVVLPRRLAITNAIKAGKVFSEFEIKNVPDGVYILRIGSHLTTQNELNSGNLSWQNKSTYVSQIGGLAGFTEITITVNGADVTIGDSVVQDLIDARLGHAAAPVAGYLKDGSSPIELAKITTTDGIKLKTDRNGFFFFGQGNPFSLASVQVYNGNISTNSFSTTNGQLTEVTLTASDNSQLTSKRSILSGKIIDNSGNSISGVKVIFERGGEGVSGADGNYQMTVYGDTFALPNPVRGGNVIFITPSGSTGIFDPKIIFIQVLVPTSIPDLNSTISVISDRAFTGLKRGGDYELVAMYYNLGNQNGSANTRKELVDGVKFHIPFPTEKNQIPPLTPAQQTQLDLLNKALMSGQQASSKFFFAKFSTSPSTISNANDSAITYITNAAEAGIDVISNTGGTTDFKYYSDKYRDSTNDSDYKFYAGSAFDAAISGVNKIQTEINLITGNFLSGIGTPEISYNITSQPPEYATHWQLAITKNNAVNRYFQWAAKTITYLDAENAATTSYEDAIYIRLDLDSIVDTTKKGFLGVHKNSKITSYSFTEGDRVRFISYTDGTLFPAYIDVPVLGTIEGGLNTAIIDKRDSLKDIKAGVLFEIYNPKLKLDTNIFFEVGDRYEIGDAGLPTRYHKNASGILNAFDTYYRVRVIPYASDAFDSINDLESKSFIEDSSFSDLYISNVSSYGRPQILNKNIKRVHRPTFVTVSDRYIPDTQINGFSSFLGADVKEYPRTFGSIQKLYSDGKRMFCYQENKIGQIPIKQSVLYDNSGQEVVATSADVLGEMVYYAGEYGIGLNPESFAVDGTRKYNTDIPRGSVLRLSDDGITPISNYKLVNFFDELSKELLEQSHKVNIYGTFDRGYGEYIISIDTENTNLKTLPKKDIILTERELKTLRELEDAGQLDALLKLQGMSKDEIIEFKNKYLVEIETTIVITPPKG